jgi:hypothetical protein
MGVGGQRHALVNLTAGKSPGTHCKEGCVDLGGRSGRMKKNLYSIGVRTANCPTRSQSIYLIHYPGHHQVMNKGKNLQTEESHNLYSLPHVTDQTHGQDWEHTDRK